MSIKCEAKESKLSHKKMFFLYFFIFYKNYHIFWFFFKTRFPPLKIKTNAHFSYLYILNSEKMCFWVLLRYMLFFYKSWKKSIHFKQWWASLGVLYYNTILKGQYCYCIGVLENMCNTGDYAILSNTKISVCNTKKIQCSNQRKCCALPNL